MIQCSIVVFVILLNVLHMHVCRACKVVLVFLPVVLAFALNRAMVHLEGLFSERHSHLVQGASWRVRAQMDREGGLAPAKFPAMEVVDLANVIGVGILDRALKCLGIDVVGGSLHHDVEAFTEERDCRAEYKECEDVGATRIGVACPFRVSPDVHDNGGNNDADTAEEIAQNVEESGLDLHVLLLLCWLVVVVVVGVAVKQRLLVVVDFRRWCFSWRFVAEVSRVVSDRLISVSMAVIVTVTVTMVMAAVAMVVPVSVSAQDEQLNEVEEESSHCHEEHNVGFNYLRLDEAFGGFNE